MTGTLVVVTVDDNAPKKALEPLLLSSFEIAEHLSLLNSAAESR